MFFRIRKRLTVTNVALMLALVFAMTGGAYAAKKYVITSTKQISPSVLKQLQGKAGPVGAPGAQGPAGLVGPAGTNGTNGTSGTSGKEGAKGDNGLAGATGATGPAGTRGSTGPTGPEGSDGTNGKPGATGPTGAAGPTGPEGVCAKASCTLPSGSTETGVWGAASGTPASILGVEHGVLATISFTVPLGEGLGSSKVHVIAEGEKGTGDGTCPTTSEASKPEAESGNLCIFITNQENVKEVPGPLSLETFESGAGKTGSLLIVPAKEITKSVSAFGTWAVTAK